MKALLPCLLLTLFAPAQSSAQQSDKKDGQSNDGAKQVFITYDCFTSQFLNRPPFGRSIDWKHGAMIVLKNVNPFLYKISIKEQHKNTILISNEAQGKNDPLTTFGQNQPQIDFGRLSNLNYLSADIPKLTRTDATVQKADENLQNARNTYIADTTELRNKRLEIAKILPGKLLLQNNKSALPDTGATQQKTLIDKEILLIDDKITASTKEIDQLTTKIKENKTALDAAEKSYKEAAESSSDLKFKVESVALLLNEYKKSVYELQEIELFYQQLLSIVYSQSTNPESMPLLKNNLALKSFGTTDKTELIRILNDRKRNLENKFGQYLDGSQDLIYFVNGRAATYETEPKIPKSEDIKLRQEAFRLYKQTAENQETKIKEYHKQIDYQTLKTCIENTVKLYDAINEQNFTITHQSHQFDDEATEVNFVITGEPVQNSVYSMSAKPINVPFSLPLKRGLKVDFSTGLFVNFLPQSEYFFEQISQNTVKVGKRRDPNRYVPTIGYLFHFYSRGSKLGGSLGASTGLDGKSLKYYIGISTMQGRSQRVIITAGLAGTQLQVPVQSQSLGKEFNAADYPVTRAVSLTPAWRAGAFVSFTFNLTSGNKNQGTNISVQGNAR
ncbi:hypothetical protein LZD49_00245 [Dyadobacter sp. CY261]|uniref:hypothetical protein n=1 Tax=Dyadobacter sp. CY261 TaxID=2907203 RepID=UPI001F1AB06A|nr:hypothetical protein [Dyadobacter sp. CY261]MCF0068876.1 hypothetical protein [Dyadobacter sp. CY261]